MFRFVTAGESHGPALTVVVEGVPAGLAVHSEKIASELARRRLGYGRGPRMKIEQDEFEILSGLRFSKTIGSPISVVVRNTEWNKWQRVMSAEGQPAGNVLTEPRPGHADLSGMLKYDLADARDVLERASARETAARTVAGAIAKALLDEVGISVLSHVVAIGKASYTPDRRPLPADLDAIDASEVRCFNQDAAKQMVSEIEAAGAAGDSLGGVVEVIAYGVPVGLGSYVSWESRLDSQIAQAMMSIQAIKGVEIGDAFRVAGLRGTEAHDEIFYDEGAFHRHTDRAGGTEGGMSIGGPIRVRLAMKPLSTLKTPLQTVDVVTKEPASAFRERTDVCSVPAAGVVAESMMALVLARSVLDKFGGDSMGDLKSSVAAYKERVAMR